MKPSLAKIRKQRKLARNTRLIKSLEVKPLIDKGQPFTTYFTKNGKELDSFKFTPGTYDQYEELYIEKFLEVIKEET